MIKSYVGGHEIRVFTGCIFDPSVRKYRGGELLTVIPYSGKMLSAVLDQQNAEPIYVNGVEIPTKTPQSFTAVDPVPNESESDYCIVSSMYVAACKSLGVDTSRLLTIGEPVVDDNNHVIGCINFNRN